MSHNAGSVESMSGVVKNVGVAYRIVSHLFPFKSNASRLFDIRHLEIRTSPDMSRDQFYEFVGLL